MRTGLRKAAEKSPLLDFNRQPAGSKFRKRGGRMALRQRGTWEPFLAGEPVQALPQKPSELLVARGTPLVGRTSSSTMNAGRPAAARDPALP
jgi:hypothetical protein